VSKSKKFLDLNKALVVGRGLCTYQGQGMKTVWIFSDRIRDRIRLERFRSVRIWVRMFNIRYRIRIRILKSYIYDVDIQSYLIRYDWHYPYSNPNPTRNIKTNMISVIFVRIRSVFIPPKPDRLLWFNLIYCTTFPKKVLYNVAIGSTQSAQLSNICITPSVSESWNF